MTRTTKRRHPRPVILRLAFVVHHWHLVLLRVVTLSEQGYFKTDKATKDIEERKKVQDMWVSEFEFVDWRGKDKPVTDTLKACVKNAYPVIVYGITRKEYNARQWRKKNP